MRVKTSVTLPSALLKEIDRLDANRSAFLERAALSFIGQQVKAELDARDRACRAKHHPLLSWISYRSMSRKYITFYHAELEIASGRFWKTAFGLEPRSSAIKPYAH